MRSAESAAHSGSSPQPVPEPTFGNSSEQSALRVIDWRSLEAGDDQVFLANLRRASCPEATISAILRSRLTSRYEAEADLFSGARGADTFDPAQQKTELMTRIDETLKRLGVGPVPRSSNVLFTAEQEQRILEARTRFPVLPRTSADPARTALIRSNRENRLEFLSLYLNSDSLLLYRLDREGEAVWVGSLLEGLEPTREEFLQVARVVLEQEVVFDQGEFTPEVEVSLRRALGPQRFELLKLLQTPPFKAIAAFGQTCQLSKEQVSTLMRARRNRRSDPNYATTVRETLPENLASLYLSNTQIHPAESGP